MLRTLLAERFKLTLHTEVRQMRLYELTASKGGLKIQPALPGEATTGGRGFHFRGDMHRFADLLGLQFSIPATDNPNAPVRASGPPVPVIDRTGLKGEYEFSADVHPELGADAFTAWQRVLEDQLGLHIESRKGDVEVVVIDNALKAPTEN
jgi:uncharacterized protein (TIGR03435 family)